MKKLTLAVFAAALALSACGDDKPVAPPVVINEQVEAPVVVNSEEEFKCPEGMPSYKCEQLKQGNENNTPPVIKE